MDKEGLVELTTKLYRLTLLFPKKEPLRYKIREAADDILADFVRLEIPGQRKKELVFELENSLAVLNGYFEVAKWQNWVNYFEVLEMEKEYGKIKFVLSEEIIVQDQGQEKEKVEARLLPTENEVNGREEKILGILKKMEKIQVGEINKLLPEVSKRTLRRDFQKLVKQGIIERIGEKNNTFYKIKVGQS